MDKLQTTQAIAVMQAYVEGKKIEWRPRKYVSTCWFEMDQLCWDWPEIEYRIKPEVVKYRRMLLKTSHINPIFYVDTVGNEEGVKRYEQDWRFVRWIDKDWIEEVV